jgi:anthranilate synthase component 1
MYTPSLEDLKSLARKGNLVPIYREVPADLETPVTAYLKVASGPYSFLLESVEGGERLARYSFIGTEPYKVLRTGNGQPEGEVDPLTLIQDELGRFQPISIPDLPPFHGGAVGYMAYEVARYFENLPSPELDVLGLPEAVFLFSDTLLLFDHLRHQIKVISHVHIEGNLEEAYARARQRIDRLVERLQQPLANQITTGSFDAVEESAAVTSNLSQEQYYENVRRAKEYIHAGDMIQVVPSQRLSRPTTAEPFDIYRAVRVINPSPYMYYLHLDDFHIIGASPELLIRVEGTAIDYHPIAGTRPRGATEEQDRAMEKELLGDEKERAEHIMLVDLGRNDVGRVSDTGTVTVTNLMEIERYSHVMHIVSHIVGKLRPDLTPFDALRACFPAGTVSGAPKIRAMEIIAELEPDKRGPYAGAVGYFSFSGNMDTAITIRTIVLKNGVAHVQAGGGIVSDSVEEVEYQESLRKAAALLRAIDRAEASRKVTS